MPYTPPKPPSGGGGSAMGHDSQSKYITNLPFPVSTFRNRFQGQPESYDKKFVPSSISLLPSSQTLTYPRLTPPPTPPLPLTEARAQYRFGRTLGAGTYGIVREAEVGGKMVAVKIILKKNVKGNEQMVHEELSLLQELEHPHVVRFVDWFESRDKYYIVTQLAVGGELFDRICQQGKFNEKDASQTIKQVLEAIDYLHRKGIVHRDLKPENLLYLSTDPDSQLVLADFGIAKMLKPGEVATTMAGSFGYAAPEVMNKRGHGKAVDMWSLGVITYTLLCGYSPFRSENLEDLLEECQRGKIIFHDKYWKDVSQEAKDFIRDLLQVDPEKRPTSEDALKNKWLVGQTASDHNIVPNIKSYNARAQLRRGINKVQLANRIEALKMQDDEEDGITESADVPADAMGAAELALSNKERGISPGRGLATKEPRDRLTRAAKAAIFREIVLAKVREVKDEQTSAATGVHTEGKS